MSDKKFVCKLDGRRFKVKAGLEQHQKDQHGPARKTAGGPTGKRAMGAMVSNAQMVKSVATDMARMSGTDRLASVAITSTSTKAGSVLVKQLIEPAAFKRMFVASRAYQRIRYTKLRFRMEPQMSTNISGGYVMGFIADPDDAEEHISLDMLTAQRGSVTTKWWQSSTLDVTVGNRLFFTNLGAEKREYSPGRLVVMCDGKPTEAGNFTLFCEWAVEMTVATLDLSTVPPTPGPPPPGDTTHAELWLQAGDSKVASPLRVYTKVAGVFTATASSIVAGARKSQRYQLSEWSTIYTEGDPEITTGFHYLTIMDTDVVALTDEQGKDLSTFWAAATYNFLPAGKCKLKKVSAEEQIARLEELVEKLAIRADGFESLKVD